MVQGTRVAQIPAINTKCHRKLSFELRLADYYLVDNIFVLVLADRSVFHPSVMLSDNRVSLAPTPKQMNIEKSTLFSHSGVNIQFTETDCPV